MLPLKGLSPALAGLGIGLLSVLPAQAQDLPNAPGRLGAFRSQLGEIAQGLNISLAEGVRYDSNIVRTSSDAETQAIYGTTDSSDIVSQTSLNLTYSLTGTRTSLQFGGDLSYAKYSNFDQFSGFVTGGTGAASWQFTDRCSTGANGRIERRVADFSDVKVANADFQLEYGGNLSAQCLVWHHIRVSANLLGDRVTNDASNRRFADVNMWGYGASLAYVSVRDNEIGVSYQHTRSNRPNDPAIPNDTNDNYSGFVRFGLSSFLNLLVSGGVEREDRTNIKTTDRGTANVKLTWTPTARLRASLAYLRDSEDATDLVGTIAETNRYSGDVDWKLTERVAAGGYVLYEDDVLATGPSSILNGISEQVTTAGLYFSHPLFRLVNVRWTAGYGRRESDISSRDYESASAGVSLGIGF